MILSRRERVMRWVQEAYGLTNYEALMIAIEIERNEILRSAFVVVESDTIGNDTPSALEKIAMIIGEQNGSNFE